MTIDLNDVPHRRYNPLTGESVLVSPHRMKRPWQGKVEIPQEDSRPKYDEKCYLCPGNERANGAINPVYDNTYVFTNDFAALLPDEPNKNVIHDELLGTEPESGICRVVCFSPRHDITLAEMDERAIRHVVETWILEYLNLSSRENIHYVQIFENKGAIMGCSNPHPHGQIWATGCVPFEVEREDRHQYEWFKAKGSCLLSDYLAIETSRGERVVCENDAWVALVPWWAKWPFETLLLPRRTIPSLTELSESDQDALADLTKRLLTRYDNLFQVSFPYTMGWHSAPCKSGNTDHWCLHAHYYPPLLRSSTVQKFMVGFEMLAMPQRDLTPETAAGMLREQSEIHYKHSAGKPGK